MNETLEFIHPLKNKGLKEIALMPGVSDLKGAQRIKFVLALKKESDGLFGEAEQLLNEAIAAN